MGFLVYRNKELGGDIISVNNFYVYRMKITFKHQILFLLLISISACKKTATVTVSVNMQSVGQPVVIGANVGVLLQRVPDSSNFQIKGTSSQGVASFEKVADGTYKVSAQ